jgi:proteasome assembly chaperone (PAC2) family protein
MKMDQLTLTKWSFLILGSATLLLGFGGVRAMKGDGLLAETQRHG